MATGKIPYTVRDYDGIRAELLTYVRTYYPDLIQDFRDCDFSRCTILSWHCSQ